jgi:hypothetical protein
VVSGRIGADIDGRYRTRLGDERGSEGHWTRQPVQQETLELKVIKHKGRAHCRPRRAARCMFETENDESAVSPLCVYVDTWLIGIIRYAEFGPSAEQCGGQ